MADEIKVGDRVQVFLNAEVGMSEGVAVTPSRHWFDGVVVRIDPYSGHRSFIWVELDEHAEAARGKRGPISVLNPKNIRKI